MIRHLEELMRNARNRLQGMNGFRGTSSGTAEAVIREDADGDGRLDPNPDLGTGEEAGFFAIRVPLVLGQDGPDLGDRWSERALDQDNWYELDEREVSEQGLATTGEIVSYVITEVGKARKALEVAGRAAVEEGKRQADRAAELKARDAQDQAAPEGADEETE